MGSDVRDEPIDHPVDDQGEAAYRGFLFADLRDYTAFVERHGDAAAADLLDAYRALVRSEVARHAGAEIRTEGDSFYVVFGSARRAVACGLAIVAAADRASRDHPGRPIKVGIGINAGETVLRGEGFVGSAVNIAARVCAEARAGELLVTRAVRDAVGLGGGLTFVARGSRRLKGIADPIPLFTVRTEAEPRRRVVITRSWAPLSLAAGAAIVAAVVILAVAVSVRGGPFAAAPSPMSEPTRSAVAASVDPSAASASPSSDPQAAAEAELIARLDESIAPHCERADPDDRPAFRIDSATAEQYGLENPVLIGYAAGVICEITSFTAPDELSYWWARQTIDFGAVDVPEALLHNEAGRGGIPLGGDCADGAPAFGEWEHLGSSGMILCRELYGDAVLRWTYDGTPILGQASRRDGDLAALLRWWEAEARLLHP